MASCKDIAADTTVPETAASDTTVPQTTITDAPVPQTEEADYEVPQTEEADTAVPQTEAAETTLPQTGAADAAALRLEHFLGEWRDSMGHRVRVKWAHPGNLAGELDVQLVRSSSSHVIRLNVKALGDGKFQCGHFQLKLEQSSVDKIVWGNLRVKGKTSVWERREQKDEDEGRSQSRSRSPVQRRQVRCCVWTSRCVLLCVEHRPRSVLEDISTPGAWAPPSWNTVEAAKDVEMVEKPLESDPYMEAYDQSLLSADGDAKAPETKQQPAAEGNVPEANPDELQKAKAKLLVHKFKMPAAEVEAKLMPVMLSKPQTSHDENMDKARPQDPRVRPAVVAPTGGA